MTTFELAEYGRVYVPIYMKPFDSIVLSPVSFKVDTGSDTTTISKSALVNLGYGIDWIRRNSVIFEDNDKPMTAAGNRIDAGYIQMPLLNILGYEGKHWPFQIIIDEDQDFRNLLGRDFLTGFNYCFNNDEDVFTISRAKTFKPRYPFLPNQEINEVLSTAT